jgi:DNA processing protein
MAVDPGIENWLRFTLVPGIGGATQRKLLKHFGSPEAALRAPSSSVSALLNAAAASAWRAGAEPAEIARVLAWLEEPGNHLLTLADAEYPAALLETADPPTVLYLKGSVDRLSMPGLAIVGSRNATPQGLATAREFARVLGSAGLTIVSGLALGIDTAAHEGGLASAGSTIAVVGTGLDIVYPARNRALAHRIAAEGTIVSEFPIGTKAIPSNFPRRNRLISGLSRGVLVVEAAIRSGSLSTARFAGEQGREVLAIPGSIHSPLSRGCHALIKQGAKLVESASDILEELRIVTPAIETADVTPDEDPLLAALGHDPCDFDTLSQRTGLPVGSLQTRLSELELEGRIACLPGGRFQRLPTN